jgi:diguanylate cyclase (GGDEF)-like protein
VAYALATAPTVGNTAALFVLPVLWTTFFFRLGGAIAIVALVGLADAIVLISLAGDGIDRWLDVMASVSAVAAVVTVLGQHNDRLLARVTGEARTDMLTGLLNRRGLAERAAIELAHARRERRSIAVATFDIDYFKRINDEWGHETGDRVLVGVAAVLRDSVREIDAVARVGGEEFVVLLPGADAAAGDALTQRVRDALAHLGAPGLPAVSISAGVAAAVAPAALEPVLQGADTALYAAKRAGRGRTAVHRDPTVWAPLVTA